MAKPASPTVQLQSDTLTIKTPNPNSEDPSDDEILELLSQVEARRRMQSTNIPKESSAPHLAKLEHSSLARPYVSTKGSVSRVDSSRILSKDERDLANQTRKVEDPMIVRKKLAKVPGPQRLVQAALRFSLPQGGLASLV